MIKAAPLVVTILGLAMVPRGEARADDAAMASARQALTRCDGLGDVARVRPVGGRPVDQVLQVWPRSGPSVLVLFVKDADAADDDEPRCVALPLVRPVRPLRGNFLPGATQAFAVTEGSCGNGACAGAVVVSQAHDPTAILDALPWPDDCYYGIELTRLRAVPGIDSLAVVCKETIGAGYDASGAIVHAGTGALRPIFTWSPGQGSFMSDDELADGNCDQVHVGRIEVVRRGRAPVLRVVQVPEDDDAGTWPAAREDRRGSCVGRRALDQRWAWDVAAQRLAPIGTPVRVRRDGCDCRRRRR